MITLEKIIAIHQLQIDEYGGGQGIRDINLLKAAIARPYQTFGDVELYPTPVEKAAAILESIIQNHPFIDGNKRTGYVLMRFILRKSEFDIKASGEEKYNFTIEVASGQLNKEQIQQWIKDNIIKLK